ncbi:MAG: ABC transporter substrate-binding protein [Treponema sp.]|nr:ABC transporter substrate-binding protein [Treponema sp.]
MKRLCIVALLLTLGVCLAFAGGRRAQSTSGVPEVVWYVVATTPQPGAQAVLDKVNEYIVPKVGATLKIMEDTGDYTQRIAMLMASQEPFDLFYTNTETVLNNYKRGVFYPMNDLLDQYGQDIKKLLPENHINAGKVDGKLYGITAQLSGVTVTTAYIEADWMRKYGFDPTTANIKDIADLEPILAAIKDDNPTMYPFAGVNGGWEIDNDYFTVYLLGAVALNDPSLKVVNKYATPEYRQYVSLMRSWFEKGYIRPDMVTYQDSTQDALIGNLPVWVDWITQSDRLFQYLAGHGDRETAQYRLTDVYAAQSGLMSAMTSISATSPNPDLAMKFYNLFLTDPYLYNLIVRGIEGVHYNKIPGSDRIELVPNSGYVPAGGWPYGYSYHKYLLERDNPVTETINFNRYAIASPIFGFNFDITPVTNEVTAINALIEEYRKQLEFGAVDPNRVLPEFLARLDAAGRAKVIVEMQRQIDAWKLVR